MAQEPQANAFLNIKSYIFKLNELDIFLFSFKLKL
jgi:hypothetical protein